VAQEPASAAPTARKEDAPHGPPRAGYPRAVVRVGPATRDWPGISWLAGQQRALDQIEKTLLTDEYHLASLLTFFTRLAPDDALPGTERVQAWPDRLVGRVGLEPTTGGL
jgi:hypothetical protein